MSSRIPTPHINAPEGAFADTVLMPGDPLRSKFIAENYRPRSTGLHRLLQGEARFRDGQRHGLSFHRYLFL